MGRVSNLRVVETLGSTVRLGWTGVAGATQYRIIILNTEGTVIHYFTIHADFYCPVLNKNITVVMPSARASCHVSGNGRNPGYQWKPNDP